MAGTMRPMFLRRAYRQHPAFRIGLRDMAGVAPGIAAWGLMTGVAMAKSGSDLEHWNGDKLIISGRLYLDDNC